MESNNKKIIVGLGVLAILIVAGFLFANKNTNTEVSNTASVYSDEQYKIRFKYPKDLYLKTREAGTQSRPQLSVVLVEKTQENIDLLEGRSTIPREGPTSINVDVYQNPQKLEASEWVRNDTNWTIANSSPAPAKVNDKEGISYTWSGLYEGRTIVVTEDNLAYTFTVTWMSREDKLLRDFENLLNSVELGEDF